MAILTSSKKRFATAVVLAIALSMAGSLARAQSDKSFATVSDSVQDKMVKLFGAGGFQGLAAYGSGFLVTEDGYILTAASHLLDTRDLVVHLSDGRKFSGAKVVALEPVLDVALVKIGDQDHPVSGLPHFDFFQEVGKPIAEPGTGVLAFSNQFEIATRGEPMSVQRGVIAAFSKLMGHKGVNEAPYVGDVYFLDAITNNPGAAGGALTDRKGQLLGIVGKEMRNHLTATWVNYAIPIQAVAKGRRGKEEVTVSIKDMLDTVINQKKPYTPTNPKEKNEGIIVYTGIKFVPNSLDRTPPYVDEVERSSPAYKGGLKPDDLIVYVDGIQVISITAFNELLTTYQPNSEMVLEVQRGNKLQTVKLVLEKKK
jgi:serine protease Do